MKRYDFKQLQKLLADSDAPKVVLSNKCTVRNDGDVVVYSYNNIHLATLEDDSTVRLAAPIEHLSFKYQSLLNNILPAIGYRLISRAGVWFVLRINTKTTTSYRHGLVLTSPESETPDEH